MFGSGAQNVEIVALNAINFCFIKQSCHSKDAIDRSAKFMTYIGKEILFNLCCFFSLQLSKDKCFFNFFSVSYFKTCSDKLHNIILLIKIRFADCMNCFYGFVLKKNSVIDLI